MHEQSAEFDLDIREDVEIEEQPTIGRSGVTCNSLGC